MPTASESQSPMAPGPDLAVVVPTLNEQENIVQIIERLQATLKDRHFEIIVVDDDSTDGTPQAVNDCRQQYPNIRLLERREESGLASAVLHGIRNTDAPVVAVIDADLQEPPEKIPEMLKQIEGSADIVIGSRYLEDSSISGWGLARKMISRTAIWMAWLLLPATRGIQDPSNGFFLVRKDVLVAELDPKGFKILMEILVKGSYERVAETPIDYVGRVKGASKVSVKQLVVHLGYLAKLSKHPSNRRSQRVAAP